MRLGALWVGTGRGREKERGRGKVRKVLIGKLVWLRITVSVNFRRGRRIVGMGMGMGKSLEGILVIAVLGRG